jgi:hypothetical protein
MTDLRAFDIQEVTEPLEDKASFNYQKKTTALSYGNKVFSGGWNYTQTLFNQTTGAAQNEAGGSGGGESSSVSG